MTCDRATMLLERRWDGALDGDEERELDEHIRGCDVCSAEAEAIALADRAFMAIPDEMPPVDIAALVSARLKAEAPVEPRRAWFAGLAALACVLVALAWHAGFSPIAWMHNPVVQAVTDPVARTVANWLSPVASVLGALEPAFVAVAKWAPVPVALEITAFGLWLAHRHGGHHARQS